MDEELVMTDEERYAQAVRIHNGREYIRGSLAEALLDLHLAWMDFARQAARCIEPFVFRLARVLGWFHARLFKS